MPPTIRGATTNHDPLGAMLFMKLFYTPRSHFSRKVRILLAAWGVDVELCDVGNVAEIAPEAFGPSPLMKVPALVDGDVTVLDSDNIARYLTRRFDPQDTFGVLTEDIDATNARAVMNGVMAADVEIVLARRTGIDTHGLPRFEKLLGSIRAGLAWLDARAALFAGPPAYAGLHLVCAWDHLALFELVDLRYPALQSHVTRLSSLPYVTATAPR